MQQEFLSFLSTAILPYPKSVLLFAIGMVNACWIFYIFFIRKNFRQKIYKIYFVFAISVFLWAWANAYAFSDFFTSFGGAGLTYTFTLAGLFTCSAMTAFYYLSAVLKSSNGKIFLYEKAFICIMILQNLFFNVIPGMAIERANVFVDGTFELIQVPFYFIFHVFNMAAIILGFANVVVALRRSSKEKKQIEKIRFIYVCIGASIMYGAAIIFHMILPYVFQNYSYSWIPPALSIFDVLIVGYGVIVERFPNISYNVSRIAKQSISFILSSGIAYIIHRGFSLTFGQITSLDAYLIPFIAIIVLYPQIFKFSNSKTFHHIFGTTSVEYFLNTIQQFRRRNIIYKNLSRFQKDIRATFCVKLQITSAKIIILTPQIHKKYPDLISYCTKNHELLVTKEIQFQQSQGEKKNIPLSQLESLGEVCMPLLHPSRGLIGFFVLGRKPFDQIYFREELQALERLQHSLSLDVTGVLYRSELQKEVDEKTASLKALAQQQSDFMAIAAHELRTPLSVALFQLEDVLDTCKEENVDPDIVDDINISLEELNNLKALTHQLFEMQQYNLGKIHLETTQVSIGEFVENIYKNFLPLTKEKSFQFSFQNTLPTQIHLHIDEQKITQVLHNLLTNAKKFTPEKGIISLTIAQHKNTVTISVIDDGKGIPDQEKGKVFQKFQTTQQSINTGIGMGLYLCKSILELHKGTIGVKDTPGGGATFFITLPLDDTQDSSPNDG